MSKLKEIKKTKKENKIKKIIIGVSLFFILLIGTAISYLSDYYVALESPASVEAVSDQVAIHSFENVTFYGDLECASALIFYPGGKVEAKAYEPLLQMIASQGIGCALVEMPFHLAIFNIDAADTVIEHFPEGKAWYLAGHSLGGAMAAEYTAEHQTTLAGLILLAAYPSSPLLEVFPVLSIRGSNDLVLNQENYNQSISNAENLTELILEGGNHGGFGNYGAQAGDGIAGMTQQEQWSQTASAIVEFINP